MVTIKTLTEVFKKYVLGLWVALMVVWIRIGMGILRLGLSSFLRLFFVSVRDWGV